MTEIRMFFEMPMALWTLVDRHNVILPSHSERGALSVSSCNLHSSYFLRINIHQVQVKNMDHFINLLVIFFTIFFSRLPVMNSGNGGRFIMTCLSRRRPFANSQPPWSRKACRVSHRRRWDTLRAAARPTLHGGCRRWLLYRHWQRLHRNPLDGRAGGESPLLPRRS